MLTKADTIRAAALGVRLEADEPLMTDWRQRYVDLARVHYEQDERLERMTDLANARQVYCVILYAIIVLLVVAHVGRSL